MLPVVNRSRDVALLLGQVAKRGCAGCALWGSCGAHGATHFAKLLRDWHREQLAEASHVLDVRLCGLSRADQLASFHRARLAEQSKRAAERAARKADPRQLAITFAGFDPRQRRLF